MEKVVIVVLNYNGYDDTIECIKSIFELDYNNYQIVIVDNDSKDNSVNKIKSFLDIYNIDYSLFQENKIESTSKKVVFIKADTNRGYSAGNNIGIKFAKLVDYNYIWVLNNDTVVAKDSLSNFVTCARNSDKKIGFFGNPIFYYDTGYLQGIGGKFNKFIAQGGGIAYKYFDLNKACKLISKVDYPIGASIFLRKNL